MSFAWFDVNRKSLEKLCCGHTNWCVIMAISPGKNGDRSRMFRACLLRGLLGELSTCPPFWPQASKIRHLRAALAPDSFAGCKANTPSFSSVWMSYLCLDQEVYWDLNQTACMCLDNFNTEPHREFETYPYFWDRGSKQWALAPNTLFPSIFWPYLLYFMATSTVLALYFALVPTKWVLTTGN
jgi:hypothetical protein